MDNKEEGKLTVDDDWMVVDPEFHIIDWERVNSLEDVIQILKALNIRVAENYENFEDVEHLLDT